jgi:hypothetical protein
MPDPDKEPQPPEDQYNRPDPHVREEVGGMLERAFRREDGCETLEDERASLQVLAQEAEEKVACAERLAQEAAESARLAAERFRLSQNLDDMETVQRWEAEATSYRREAENLRLEAERLRKYMPG